MEIDIHLDGAWQACARFTRGDAGQSAAPAEGGFSFRYDADYALCSLQARDFRAVSVRLPVDLAVRRPTQWPPFLLDLLPGQAARTRLCRSMERPVDDWALLERGAANPVGNLRIRPREARGRGSLRGFTLAEMTSRGEAFLDTARQAGAAVAGSTDVGGEAPKCWIVATEADLWLPDDGRLGSLACRYALLKFPVPEAGTRATDILRHEAAYQRVAQRLGLSVTSELPEFVDGALLIPRFDRRAGPGGEVRLGVESLCSLAGVRDQDPLSHPEALLALQGCLTDFDADLMEYLRRDILNLALGNRDNGGRATAVLKDTDGTVRLAPLFGMGPSFLDERPSARAMRWDGEASGPMDWGRILANLEARFARANRVLGDIRVIARQLQAFSRQLGGLPDVMLESGVDERVVQQRRAAIAILTRALGELDAL